MAAIKLRKGQKGIVVWEANKTNKVSQVRADRFDNPRTRKIILPAKGFRPRAGESWFVEVMRETKPGMADKGCYTVKGISKKTILSSWMLPWID